MTLVVHCPACRTDLTLGLSMAGQPVRCPRCTHVFQAAAPPRNAAPPIPFYEPAPVAARPSAPPSTAPPTARPAEPLPLYLNPAPPPPPPARAAPLPSAIPIPSPPPVPADTELPPEAPAPPPARRGGLPAMVSAFVVLCGLMTAGVVLFLNWRTTPPAPEPTSDLLYVPDGCHLVASVNVPACLAHGVYQQLHDAGAGLDPCERAAFKRLTGLDPSEVERLTFACSLSEPDTWALVLRASRSVVPSDLRVEGEAEPREECIGTSTIYERAEDAFLLPDVHTVVVAPAAVLRRVLERGRPVQLPSGFEPVGQPLPPGEPLRAVVDARLLPREGAQVGDLDVSPLPGELPMTLGAVLVQVTSDPTAELQARATCQDAAEAADLAEKLRKAVVKLTVLDDLDPAQLRLLEAPRFEADGATLLARLPLNADLLRAPITDLKWEGTAYCIEALTAESEERREEAEARLLQQPARSAPVLARLLVHSDAAVRDKAAALLARLDKQAGAAAPPLARMLSDPRPAQRRAAARAIGLLGPGARGAALAALLRCQADPDAEVSREVRAALERLGTLTDADFKALLDTIRDPKIEARARSTALATLLTREALQTELPLHAAVFIAAAKDPDKEVRRLATIALAKIGPKRREDIFPTLLAALKDKEEGVRAAAVTGLAGLGTTPPAEVTPLIELFKDDELPAPSRAAAALALARCLKKDRDDVFAVLFDGLNHHDAEMRKASAAALEKLGPPKPGDLRSLARELGSPTASAEMTRYVLGALARLGPRVDRELYPNVVRTLMDLLNSADARQSEAAFEAIKAMGPARDVEGPLLVRLLKDGKAPPRRRAYAAWALGPIAREVTDADRVLLEALADTEVAVRRAAAEAVGKAALKSPAAVQALAKALGDADRDVRLGAAAALGALPADARPLPHLLRAYEDDDEAVMRKAAEGLARYGKPSKADLPLLGEALGSAKLRTRLFAVTTLAEFGRDALPVLEALANAVGDADPTVRRLAVGALRALGTDAKDAAPAIARQLNDKNPRVRLEAAATLIALKTDAQTVVPVLLEAAIDKDGPDRPLALESLRRLGDWAAPAVPFLVRTAEKEEARGPACDALVAVGKPAVEAVKNGLRSKDAAIRQALVEVLGRIGPPARTALLEVNTMALRDPVPEVRMAARKASELIQKK